MDNRRQYWDLVWPVAITSVLLAWAAACSSSSDNDASGDQNDDSSPVMAGGGGMSGSATEATDSPGDQSSSTAADGSQSEGNDSQPSTGGSDSSQGESSDDGESSGEAPVDMETLDPDTDWEALQVIFPTMYSAYDGEHIFQVPAHVEDLEVELSDWQAIPSSAVSFDADPETGGVLITVQEAVPEVTIAVSTNGIGGTAPLYITEATPEDWAVGEARYANGVDYEIPMFNFADLFDPNYTPPETPDNLACNNCHTDGAKYLEIQHTPTQIGYISDEDLRTILEDGMKPEGIEFSLLPPELEHLYAEFHTWEASEDEILGLIVYLRSLTPKEQGDVNLEGLGVMMP